MVDSSSAERRDALECAEAALREALEERNRLWGELQKRHAVQEDLAFWRSRAEGFERSRWWKLGAPLRVARRMLTDPPGTLNAIAHDLRHRRRRR